MMMMTTMMMMIMSRFKKVKNADLMWKQSVWSSAIAASLASRLIFIAMQLLFVIAV